MVNLRE